MINFHEIIACRKLVLFRNEYISDEGVQYLTNLTDFDLYKNNSVSNKALRLLTNLKVLDLSFNNKITIEGMIIHYKYDIKS